MVKVALDVHRPEEAARRLGGMTVANLVALLKARGYAFTELSPGVLPWGKGARGRKHWGLTDDQIAAIIAGQARSMPKQDPADVDPEPTRGIPGHDGIDRFQSRHRSPRTS